MRLHWIDPSLTDVDQHGISGAHARWVSTLLYALLDRGDRVFAPMHSPISAWSATRFPTWNTKIDSVLGLKCDIEVVFHGGTSGPWTNKDFSEQDLRKALVARFPTGLRIHLGYVGMWCPEAWEPMDRWWAISEYHKRFYMERHGIPEASIFVLGLPSTYETYEDFQGREQFSDFIYASSPDRGLRPLLDIWPKIRAACPGSELRVTYSSTTPDDRSSLRQQGVRASRYPSHYRTLEVMAQHPVMLYPDETDSELFCYSVREAIAVGCVPLVTPRGALPEAVGTPLLVAEYPEPFTTRAIALMRDSGLRKNVLAAARHAGGGRMNCVNSVIKALNEVYHSWKAAV